MPAESSEYIGLTKEQLAQYANDPFWRTLRIILFILFWLAWIAMLAAAIFIVIVSPKCPVRQEPQWWQKKVSYETWIPSVSDSDGDGVGDIAGLSSRISDLRRAGAQTIRAAPLVAHSDAEGLHVTNFSAVHSQYGTMEQFEAFVDEVHGSGMFVVIDLPLAITSKEHPWFKLSENRTYAGEKADFYIWKSGLANPNGQFFKEHGGRFHLAHAETGMPVLNWRNPKVQETMRGIMNGWLDKGVDGFFIPDAHYFSRSEDGSKPVWPKVAQRLGLLRETADTHRVNNDGVDSPVLLYTALPSDWSGNDAVRTLLIEEGKVNYVVNDDLVWPEDDACFRTTGKCLAEKISQRIEEHDRSNLSYPMWEIGNSRVPRIATRAGGPAQAELWNMMLLMLPGSVNSYFGDEITMTDSPNKNGQRSPMQWSDGANAGFSETADALATPVDDDFKSVNFHTQYYTDGSALKMFRRLAKMRQIDNVVLNGGTFLQSGTGDQALVFSRYKLDAETNLPGRIYVTLLNFGDTPQTVTLDETVLPVMADKRAGGAVVTVTSNAFGEGTYWPRSDIDLSAPFTIPPHQGIVAKYN